MLRLVSAFVVRMLQSDFLAWKPKYTWYYHKMKMAVYLGLHSVKSCTAGAFYDIIHFAPRLCSYIYCLL